MKKSKVIFPQKAIEKRIFAKMSALQTERLIEYATAEIQQIGNDISVFPFANNLDRTGNLLDSLCWAVYYNGSRKRAGYYRNMEASEISHLHEYSRPMGKAVSGHYMAQQFIQGYRPKNDKGWELFFAVLAPYWGYWETGFGARGKELRWKVMTRHYDVVSNDLKSADVTINIYRAS
jgi:hypothetical protein